MNVRIRKKNLDGEVKLDTSGTIHEVLINEDFLNPDKESISICFRGKNTYGIIDLTPDEIETLYARVRDRMHLIKGTQLSRGNHNNIFTNVRNALRRNF